ncbi:MAG: hypothetical protein PF495_02215 [Spirochaetales bacterium]|jgi:hypothetical protein|nr:hypothetical protein [Spirochaetales bacterium]
MTENGRTLVESLEPGELGAAETMRLKELEVVIAENFQGFYAVGSALAEINSSRLYRATHETFEDYCRERFEVSRRSAYQYIEAKKVIDNVYRGTQTETLPSEVMDNVRHGAQTLLPLNERQVRPLTKLEPEIQAQAWEDIIASAPEGRVTAKYVNEMVCKILGAEIKKKAEKIKSDVKIDTVPPAFIDALWALIEAVRVVVAKPMKKTMRENMRDSIRRVENLLAD